MNDSIYVPKELTGTAKPIRISIMENSDGLPPTLDHEIYDPRHGDESTNDDQSVTPAWNRLETTSAGNPSEIQLEDKKTEVPSQVPIFIIPRASSEYNSVDPDLGDEKFANGNPHLHSKANDPEVCPTDPVLLYKWAEHVQLKKISNNNPRLNFCVHCNVDKENAKIVYCSLCYRQTCELCSGSYILPEKHGKIVVPQMLKEKSSLVDLHAIEEDAERHRPTKSRTSMFRKGRKMTPSQDNKWKRVCIPCRNECMRIRQEKTGKEVNFRPGRECEEKDGLLIIKVPDWDPKSNNEPCFECGVKKVQDSSNSVPVEHTTVHNCRLCGHVFCAAKCSFKFDFKIPHNFLQKGKKGPTRLCLECRFLLYQDDIRLDGGLGPQKPEVLEIDDYGGHFDRLQRIPVVLSQLQEKYTILPKLRRLAFVAIFMTDTISDIVVAAQLKRGGDIWWFRGFIFCIFLPYFIALVMLFRSFTSILDYEIRGRFSQRYYYVFIVLYFLCGMPLMLMYDIVFVVLATVVTLGTYQTDELGKLYEMTRCGITEAFGESLPLMCLNIYIFVEGDEDDKFQIRQEILVIAILSSMLSLGKALFFMRKFVFYIAATARIRKTLVKIREDTPLESGSFGSDELEIFGKLSIQEIWSLATAIKYNHTIKTLTLPNIFSHHSLEASQALATIIRANRTITKVDFSQNAIQDEGATILAEALAANSTLINIDLSDNLIGDDGARAIGEALLGSKSLEWLDLHGNTIGDVGGFAIDQALQQNPYLQYINIRNNQIDKYSAQLQRTAAHKSMQRVVDV